MSDYVDDKKEPKITKDHDWVMVFCDGAIVNIDEQVCRLIFYQEHLDLTDKENVEGKPILIKFEVRMPYSAVQRLGEHIENLTHVMGSSDLLVNDVKDERTGKALGDLRRKVAESLFDTSEDGSSSSILKQEYDELEDRVFKEHDAVKER